MDICFSPYIVKDLACFYLGTKYCENILYWGEI